MLDFKKSFVCSGFEAEVSTPSVWNAVFAEGKLRQSSIRQVREVAGAEITTFPPLAGHHSRLVFDVVLSGDSDPPHPHPPPGATVSLCAWRQGGWVASGRLKRAAAFD